MKKTILLMVLLTMMYGCAAKNNIQPVSDNAPQATEQIDTEDAFFFGLFLLDVVRVFSF